ncbi:hypothetical protein L9F63_016596 [Diploptera punctata]|uniref:Lipocalin/cytosolic fatty-acid binding domain-containing protein n=1 Tax=Diploptera punctata TaxID=6984 RepID=A0AAD8A0N9_DIPPU|nr:hypothetical protein L9F63_016596 [Diploptera punctata]
MKTVFVLVVVTILQVTPQEPCPPQDLNIDPKAFEGIWYVRATKPDIFQEDNNIKENYTNIDEDNDTVTGTVTTRVNGTKDEHSIATLMIMGRNLTRKYSTEGENNYTAIFEILAYDDQYIIEYGKPPEESKTGLVFIRYRDECPDNQTQDKVEEALINVCLNFSDFSVDKELNCN